MISDVVMAENLHDFLTMSNQYRAQMVNSAHMANNPLGINVDDICFRPTCTYVIGLS